MTVQIKSDLACTDRSLPMLNPLWTPTLLTNVMEYWTADKGLSLDVGGEVKSWTGAAKGLLMTGSGASRPVASNAMNGINVPLFAGSHSLAFGNIFNESAASIKTFWSAMDVIANPMVGQRIIDLVSTNLYLNQTNGYLRASMSGSSLDYNGFSTGKAIIVSYHDSSDSLSKLRINGVTIKTSAGATAMTTQITGSGGTLGRYRGTPEDFIQNSAIAEVGIAKESKTLAEIQKLEGYLAHKFMTTNPLPANHPYYAKAPRKKD